MPFTRDNALDAIGKVCGQAAGLTLPLIVEPIVRTLIYDNVIINPLRGVVEIRSDWMYARIFICGFAG